MRGFRKKHLLGLRAELSNLIEIVVFESRLRISYCYYYSNKSVFTKPLFYLQFILVSAGQMILNKKHL